MQHPLYMWQFNIKNPQSFYIKTLRNTITSFFFHINISQEATPQTQNDFC